MEVYIHTSTKSHHNCTAIVAFRDLHHPLIWSIKNLSILSDQPTQFTPGGVANFDRAVMSTPAE